MRFCWRLPPALCHYGGAVLAVGVATYLRWAVTPLLGERSPFLLFTPGVMVAAWYGGLGPGLLATLLSALIGSVLFLDPTGRIYPDSAVDHLRVWIFAATGVCITLLSGQLHLARNRAENHAERVAALSSAKDEFMAMLAHELRNPLGAICNALQVIQLREGDDPAVTRARRVIDRQVRHMTRLLDDLLDANRLTRGLIELRRETVSVREAVANALETMRPLVELKGHEARIHLGDDPVLTAGDLVRLEQAFTNLLNNAAKYTPDGGIVEVSLTRENGDAVCSVRDNGRGIPPALLPHLFDLFVQGERGRDRAEGGLGIGLYLVKRIVELHGGSVAAFSPGLGHGSEFVVRLPVMPPAAPPRPALLTDAPAPRYGEPVRVLIVEDNVDAGATLAEILELLGHRPHLALDGPAALEWAEGHPFDAVLLDIGLPGMDGYEVARRLRARHGSGPLLVALTGYGQDEDRQRSREAGCNLHLTKPVNMSELERVLASMRRE